MYLKNRQRRKGSEYSMQEKIREKVSPLPVLSQNKCNKQVCARPNTGVKNSVLVSYLDVRVHALLSPSIGHPRLINRKLDYKEDSGDGDCLSGTHPNPQ